MLAERTTEAPNDAIPLHCSGRTCHGSCYAVKSVSIRWPRRPRLAMIAAIAVFFPFLTGFGAPGFLESDAARVPVTAATMSALPAKGVPVIRARGAILVDGTNGNALWEREADQRLPMASTTKIMTALVAVEQGKLDLPVRVVLGADRFPGESVAGLRAGEIVPMGEALYALLLPSGNDAAVAIAGAVAGSTDAFVARMNARAEALGLRNLRFANPSGLDAAGHYASARDLARLTRVAADNATLAEVVGTREHSWRGQFVYRWTNLNRMLMLRPDVTGFKTGTTESAGESLVTTARQGARRVTVVLLNSPDRYREGNALLDYFFNDLSTVTFELPPSPFFRGLSVIAPPVETLPSWQSRLATATFRLSDPAESGIGVVTFDVAGRTIGPPIVVLSR